MGLLKCRREDGELKSDSISSLPDEILGKILSLLHTKLAASTSILSKRWRNLLLLVDGLDFDDSVFLYPDTDRSTTGFSDFVDTTVDLLSSCPIKSFSLNGSYKKSRVDGWICTAMQRSCLSELHLRCPHRIDRDIELLFQSKTLVKLTLSHVCVIEFVPEKKKKRAEEESVVFFPMLKSLSIGHIVISQANYIRLIRKCPVLEELFIRNGDNQTLPPSWVRGLVNDSLKRLVIYFHVPKYRKVYEDRVAVLAPHLTYFEYSSYVSRHYILSTMRSLVEARLDLRLWESTISYDDDDDVIIGLENGYSVVFGNTTYLIDSISRNVKTLHLSPHSLEAIHFCCEFINVFKNLLTLSFESDKDIGWHVVPRLLKRAPNLQTLVIKGLVHRVTAICGDVCPCFEKLTEERLSKTSTLATVAVKVLEISGYGGTRREIEQMRHFLGNLKCLELVKIGVQEDADNKSLRFNLMSLPTLSSKCKILFI